VARTSIGTWAFGIYSSDPLDFGVVLDRIAELGFDGIELGAFPPHPDPVTFASAGQRAELRSAINDRGLEVSAVAADFGDAGFLASDDSASYLAAVDRNLGFCEAIGTGRLIVNTVDPPEAPLEIGAATARRRLLAAWSQAAARAEARGIELTWEFEPCWAFNAPEEIIELAHDLAGPGFGVLYDTAHGHAVSVTGARHPGGARPLAGGQQEFLDRLAGTINHVHLLDSDGSIVEHEESSERTTVHVPFGRGAVDFDRVIPALVAAGGATEWWTVDLCYWPDAWQATAESKRFVDELLGQFVP
jgi:sugar phosphate isomerase/epimerase